MMQDEMGWRPVSTGEEIRIRMSDPESEIGNLSRPFMDRGDYVPDELANRLFDEIVGTAAADTHLILDGYPRTVPQAERMENWIRDSGHGFEGCLFLQLDPGVAAERMRNRKICPVCRKSFPLIAGSETGDICEECGGVALIPREDDDPERMGRRVARHYEMTAPLRDWYHERNQLVELDASKTPNDLLQEIVPLIGDNQKKERL